jgi:hypothetical protein
VVLQAASRCAWDEASRLVLLRFGRLLASQTFGHVMFDVSLVLRRSRLDTLGLTVPRDEKDERQSADDRDQDEPVLLLHDLRPYLASVALTSLKKWPCQGLLEERQTGPQSSACKQDGQLGNSKKEAGKKCCGPSGEPATAKNKQSRQNPNQLGLPEEGRPCKPLCAPESRAQNQFPMKSIRAHVARLESPMLHSESDEIELGRLLCRDVARFRPAQIRNGDIAAVGAVISGGEPRFVGRSCNYARHTNESAPENQGAPNFKVKASGSDLGRLDVQDFGGARDRDRPRLHGLRDLAAVM